jgi:hypothetical protein
MSPSEATAGSPDSTRLDEILVEEALGSTRNWSTQFHSIHSGCVTLRFV